MGSAKTMNLLAVAHTYRAQGKRVRLLKPRVDERFSERSIVSRSGLQIEADELLAPGTVLDAASYAGLACVLVDEAQFLTPFVVEQLRSLTLNPGVPVICYGLRTDFRGRLFPGSQRLMELADNIEEVKVTCALCEKKATMNMRSIGGRPTREGAQVQLGAEESYAPVCFRCYDERLPMFAAGGSAGVGGAAETGSGGGGSA